MVAFVKYNALIDEVAQGNHNFYSDTLKCALTNTTPGPNTDTIWNNTVAPPPTNTNGYPVGGNTLLTMSAATSSAIFRLIVDDTIFITTAGGIGLFRYAIIYNSTKSNKLIGYYDYGSSINMAINDTFTVNFDNDIGVLSIA